jgi:cell division protein FtsI (penicillin-binding protein 3)
MLETVVQSGGTGRRARVRGYRVAGKTGTAYIAGKHGYDQHRYIASFVGMAPVSKPRFVIAVVIKEPDVAHHYGGIVAAPIFSKIMAGTLRLYHVSGDQHAAG